MYLSILNCSTILFHPAVITSKRLYLPSLGQDGSKESDEFVLPSVPSAGRINRRAPPPGRAGRLNAFLSLAFLGWNSSKKNDSVRSDTSEVSNLMWTISSLSSVNGWIYLLAKHEPSTFSASDRRTLARRVEHSFSNLGLVWARINENY